jgi:predicted transcriptional regulator
MESVKKLEAIREKYTVKEMAEKLDVSLSLVYKYLAQTRSITRHDTIIKIDKLYKRVSDARLKDCIMSNLSEYVDQLIDECLDFMDRGMSAGEAASEVQLQHKLNDSQTDDVLLRANREFYDRRSDIGR